MPSPIAFAIALPGILAVGAGLGWLIARARRRTPHSPGASLQGIDGFKFQLVLVLLPVLLLSSFAFYALTRERSAVDEELRVRSREVAGEILARLGQPVADQWTELEVLGDRWATNGLEATDWRNWGTDEERTIASTHHFLDRFSDSDRLRSLRPESIFPLILRLDANGSPLRPPLNLSEARPPDWFSTLNGSQRRLWLQFEDDLRDSPDAVLPELLTARVPPHEVELRRRLAVWTLNAQSLSAGEQAAGLLRLVPEMTRFRAQSDSGLPLGIRAVAEAHRLLPAGLLGEDCFRAVHALTLDQPSFADEWLLTTAEAVNAISSDLATGNCLQILRARSHSLRHQADLASALTRILVSNSGVIPSNAWLSLGSEAWLVNLRPDPASGWIASGLPERLLRELLHNALTGRKPGLAAAPLPLPRLPAGTSFSVSLEGHRIPLADFPNTLEVSLSKAPVIAEVTGNLGSPFLSEAIVRIHLIDRNAVYRQQRQRELWMGAMVLLTMAIAGLGARQAHRAYTRQIALNEQKSNFVSSVSHELRAPLASMRLLAEGLVAGRVSDEAKRREYAGFMLQEIRRLGSLVENVLDFARIEQGRKQFDFEWTDPSRLVTETIRLMEPLAREQGVTLVGPAVDTPMDFGTGYWDGPAIQRVLLNLLDNALKHSPPGSSIVVKLAPSLRPGFLQMTVTDQGPGIPPADHARIFERFHRRGSELRRETRGVGLGLAIVQHIVAAHGGAVSVQSVEGSGATFSVELPTATPESNEPNPNH